MSHDVQMTARDAAVDILSDVLRAAIIETVPDAALTQFGGAPLIYRVSAGARARAGGAQFATAIALKLFLRNGGGSVSGGSAGIAAALAACLNGSDTPSIASVFKNPNARCVAVAAPSGHVNIECLDGVIANSTGSILGITVGPAVGAAPTARAPARPVGRPHTWRVEERHAVFDAADFELFVRYQREVHGDTDVTRASYTRFLCSSPLQREPWGGPPGLATAVAAAPSGSGGGSAGNIAAVSRAWICGEGGSAGLPLGSPPANGAASAGEASHAPPLSAWLRGFGDAAPTADEAFPDLVCRSDASLLALGYGAVHHRYFLDETLVAVAVLDVLPGSLSSVYVFYDPAVAKTLPLGKLTALREIQWLQRVSYPPPSDVSGGHRAEGVTAGPAANTGGPSPRLRSYLMGFYVDSCVKMRYKGEYGPCELLCPVTRASWIPLPLALPRARAAHAAPLVDAEALEAWIAGKRMREASDAVTLARAKFRISDSKEPLSWKELSARLTTKSRAKVQEELLALMAVAGTAAARIDFAL